MGGINSINIYTAFVYHFGGLMPVYVKCATTVMAMVREATLFRMHAN